MPSTTDIPTAVRFFGAAQQAKANNTDPFAGTPSGFSTGSDGSTRNQSPEAFWDTAYVDDIKQNWDKVYPFQLVLLTKNGKTYKVGGDSDRFTMPVPPQAMAISTPFAINTSVTMGGILEEHNGAPIRTITISGTTGILPLRGTVAKPSSLATGIGGVFAGTVTAVGQVTTSVSQARNLIGAPNSLVNAVSDQDLQSNDSIKGTGFYQFQLLKRFLESYAARKRAGEKDLRLGLAIWKENEIYLVTPVAFDMARSAAAPLEYPYTLVFKAWRRINVKDQSTPGAYDGVVGGRDPNKLAQLVNGMTAARSTLEGVRDVLEGVRADIQNVLFTPLRQASLFCKDAVGVVITATDLPTDIISDLKEPILEAAATAEGVQQLGRIGQRFQPNLDAAVNAVQEAFRQLAISSGKADAGSGTQQQTVGVTRQAQFSAPGAYDADPANKVTDNPTDNFNYFNTIRPSDLNLRPATIAKIEAEKKKVRQLRREDFEAFRDQTLQVLADYSDFVGAGDATYTATYGLPKRTSARTPTDDDFEVIYALDGLAQQYDTLAASSQINKYQVTSLDYVAGLATRSGIAFQVPQSKFAVPFPYGHTLEQLAEQYLGDADRWIEIATLNGLRAPYVDEIGFKLPFLTNGSGYQITVTDASNLYVGQKVWLASNTVQRENRRIQKINQLDTNQWVVQLDGTNDLSKFSTVALSYLQAFLPDTVNSQQQIYIPSDTTPGDDDYQTKTIPGVDYFDPLVKVGGIDLLLTQGGDLVITPNGTTRLAVGLTNIIQRIRIVLGTPRGSLLNHPDFGIGLKPGISTADISAQDVLTGLQQFFRDDPTFTGLKAVSVLKTANSLQAKLTVGIAGVSQYVPVAVDIRR